MITIVPPQARRDAQHCTVTWARNGPFYLVVCIQHDTWSLLNKRYGLCRWAFIDDNKWRQNLYTNVSMFCSAWSVVVLGSLSPLVVLFFPCVIALFVCAMMLAEQNSGSLWYKHHHHHRRVVEEGQRFVYWCCATCPMIPPRHRFLFPLHL